MNPGDRRRSAQGRVQLWASQAAKSAHTATTPLALDLTLPQGVGNMQYLTFLTCFRLFEAPHRRQGLVCDDKTYSGFIQPQVRFRPMRAQPSAILGASFRRRSTGGSWVYPVDVFLGVLVLWSLLLNLVCLLVRSVLQYIYCRLTDRGTQNVTWSQGIVYIGQ